MAADSLYAPVLTELREKTLQMEQENKSAKETFEPVAADAQRLIDWVKTEKPELYQQMLDGVEIGFQTLGKEYKNAIKEK